LTPTASRENISAIIELTDEKGSRAIGVAHRSGALSLRDEAAIFARSASLRRASANRAAANPMRRNRTAADLSDRAATAQSKHEEMFSRLNSTTGDPDCNRVCVTEENG
jgi:hypothetical protein